MPRLTIKRSLVFIFLSIILLTLGLVYLSTKSLDGVNAAAVEVADDWLPSVSAANALESRMLGLRIGYLTHITSNSEEGKANGEKEIADQNRLFDEGLERYRKDFAATDVEKRIVGDIRAAMDRYEVLATQLVTLSRQNKNEEAVQMLVPMRKEALAALDKIQQLVKFNSDGSAQSAIDAKATYASAVVDSFSLAGIILFVMLIAIAYVLRGVTSPIEKITGAISNLAAGDTRSAIPYSKRNDEIGEIAKAIEIFRQAALSNIELEADAKTQRETAEADRIRVTAEADENARARVQQATSGLAGGLKRLAAGDLSFQISEPFANDFEQLRHDPNQAVEQLGNTLTAVAETTGSIDNGSREIAEGSNDLSKRTEQQAASLEETAAALDQITANVANSSKRAEEARNIVAQTNASATQSGIVVAKAVEAMQGIERSSNQISNIIGVIDEIAFQTNLLALNAGVEAARAGDAGRGFAVVAQEVRELAQRSAQAAKEIKELIRTSATEVQGGVKLVSETGEALKTIQQFVGTINQHMDAIAISSREQSVGLAEVNTAVNDMDQVTQKNAAMVEETNAASATLATESGRLRDLIGEFTLPAQRVAASTEAQAVQRRANGVDYDKVRSEASSLRTVAKKMASGGRKSSNKWEEF